jgi:hypothetical protein
MSLCDTALLTDRSPRPTGSEKSSESTCGAQDLDGGLGGSHSGGGDGATWFTPAVAARQLCGIASPLAACISLRPEAAGASETTRRRGTLDRRQVVPTKAAVKARIPGVAPRKRGSDASFSRA